MTRSTEDFFPEDWLRDHAATVFYRSERQWAATPAAQKSAHFMRRAWEQLQLEGILTVEDKPTVYFKRVTRRDPIAEAELHRRLWNQGAATLLVVRDANEVRVYSALATPEKSPIADNDDARLVETLTQVRDALQLTEFVRRVETGRIYEQHRKNFQAENGVDRTLLRNLKAASKLLCDGNDKLKPSVAHALLGRLLFTCYLRARGVLSDDYLKRDAGIALPRATDGESAGIQQIFNEGSATEAKETLFKIFSSVQHDFNGSLFGKELEGESRVVRAAHINVLRDFLNGVEHRQGSLGFPAYDFRLIPIETISAIYESFLRNESQTRQNQTGSFYTPRHLAEMTVDIATEGWATLLDKKFCDPSVGSGIFLVILFNRMAEEWRVKNLRKSNLERAVALRELLCERFWGVDLNPTACRITCFSLYLALFDQLEPADIWALKKKLETDDARVLPPLLALPLAEFKDTQTPRVLADNFFSKNLPLPTDFNLIIGNPPWLGRNHGRDLVMEKWLLSNANPFLKDAPKGDADRRNYFFPEAQRAHGFMWKAPAHLCKDGRACFVLPTKVFMNERTNDFQVGWLKHFSTDCVIQLSDYRKLIFQAAKCPAVIVRFSPTKPAKDAVLRYDAPKVDRSDPRHALITVLSEDQKALRVDELISAALDGFAPAVWKQAMWGTGRDLAFLHRLSHLPKLGDIAGDFDDKSKRWAMGGGYQPFSEKKFRENPDAYLRDIRTVINPWWSEKQRFLATTSNALDLVVFPDDAPQVRTVPRRLRRQLDERLATPPMVLISRVFGKAGYCDFSVIFEHTLQSVVAKQTGDEDLLYFLAAVVTHPITEYFLFHSSANVGTEREVVNPNELRRLPFPLPKTCRDQSRAERIVADVAKRVRATHKRIARAPLNLPERDAEIAAAKRDIKSLVLEYYGVTATERILIEDTVDLFIPSSTPGSLDGNIPTLDDSSPEEREAYAKQICQTINAWGRGKGQILSARGCIAENLGLSLLVLTKGKTKSEYTEAPAPDEVAKAIAEIEKAITVEHRKIAYARGFTLFERDRAYVLKPLARRHWTRTAALNDADAMLAARLEPDNHRA